MKKLMKSWGMRGAERKKWVRIKIWHVIFGKVSSFCAGKFVIVFRFCSLFDDDPSSSDDEDEKRMASSSSEPLKFVTKRNLNQNLINFFSILKRPGSANVVSLIRELSQKDFENIQNLDNGLTNVINFWDWRLNNSNLWHLELRNETLSTDGWKFGSKIKNFTNKFTKRTSKINKSCKATCLLSFIYRIFCDVSFSGVQIRESCSSTC